MPRNKAAKRELVNTGTDKRYVRRGVKGQFKESDDVGRSLAQDRKRDARTKSAKGQGGPRRPMIACPSAVRRERWARPQFVLV